jgi:Putative GTPase activating protein for Arf
MSNLKSQVNEREAAAIRQRLASWARERNPACADCGRANPTWASVNLGVLVCLECAGRHRGLGTHISKMRSITLDTVLPEEARFLINMSNELANRWWEAQLDSTDKTAAKASPTFIESKYTLRKWALQDDAVPVPSRETVPDSHPWCQASTSSAPGPAPAAVAPAACQPSPAARAAAPAGTAAPAARVAVPQGRHATPPPARLPAAPVPTRAPAPAPESSLIDFGEDSPRAHARPASSPVQHADPFSGASAQTGWQQPSGWQQPGGQVDPFGPSVCGSPSRPSHSNSSPVLASRDALVRMLPVSHTACIAESAVRNYVMS